VPPEVRERFSAYFDGGRDYLQTVTYLDRGGVPALRVKASDGGGLIFQTADFVTNEVRYDQHVWENSSGKALRSGVTQEPYGAALRITAPSATPSLSRSTTTRPGPSSPSSAWAAC
jgi:hypothetical protein